MNDFWSRYAQPKPAAQKPGAPPPKPGAQPTPQPTQPAGMGGAGRSAGMLPQAQRPATGSLGGTGAPRQVSGLGAGGTMGGQMNAPSGLGQRPAPPPSDMEAMRARLAAMQGSTGAANSAGGAAQGQMKANAADEQRRQYGARMIQDSLSSIGRR